MARRSSSKNVAREMFVRTRRAWKDGSKIEIDFTSVTEKRSENYTVTLYNDGEHIDTCTCTGFSYRSHCCHLDHFRMVEQLRTAMTTPAASRVSPLTAVLVEAQQIAQRQQVTQIEAVIAQLTSKMGKQVVTMGVPATPLQPVPQQRVREAEFVGARATLNQNQGFSLLKRSA